MYARKPKNGSTRLYIYETLENALGDKSTLIDAEVFEVSLASKGTITVVMVPTRVKHLKAQKM
jgi:hypothetical protein